MADRSTLLAAKLRALVDAPGAEPAAFPGGAALVGGLLGLAAARRRPADGPRPRPRVGRPARCDRRDPRRRRCRGGRRGRPPSAAVPRRRPPCWSWTGRRTVPAEPALVDGALGRTVGSRPRRAARRRRPRGRGGGRHRPRRGARARGRPHRARHHVDRHADRRARDRGGRGPRRPRDDRDGARRPPADGAARARARHRARAPPPGRAATPAQPARPRALAALALAARAGARRLHRAARRAAGRPPSEPEGSRPSRSRLGVDDHGDTVVVACSVGVHLDLVPAAADARGALAPEARLLLVLPERDAHPVTQALAARLLQPADLVPLDGDWRT